MHITVGQMNLQMLAVLLLQDRCIQQTPLLKSSLLRCCVAVLQVYVRPYLVSAVAAVPVAAAALHLVGPCAEE